MKVSQHTRNGRDLFFKPDRPYRFNGDSLLISRGYTLSRLKNCACGSISHRNEASDRVLEIFPLNRVYVHLLTWNKTVSLPRKRRGIYFKVVLKYIKNISLICAELGNNAWYAIACSGRYKGDLKTVVLVLGYLTAGKRCFFSMKKDSGVGGGKSDTIVLA